MQARSELQEVNDGVRCMVCTTMHNRLLANGMAVHVKTNFPFEANLLPTAKKEPFWEDSTETSPRILPIIYWRISAYAPDGKQMQCRQAAAAAPSSWYVHVLARAHAELMLQHHFLLFQYHFNIWYICPYTEAPGVDSVQEALIVLKRLHMQVKSCFARPLCLDAGRCNEIKPRLRPLEYPPHLLGFFNFIIQAQQLRCARELLGVLHATAIFFHLDATHVMPSLLLMDPRHARHI